MTSPYFPYPLRGQQILLVTYDLRAPLKNYAAFYEALKKQGNWWHYLTSTWLIATAKTPQEVYSELAPHLTTRDLVLVTPIGRPCWGFLPKDAWDWIERNIG